jgi:hypothetical protein
MKTLENQYFTPSFNTVQMALDCARDAAEKFARMRGVTRVSTRSISTEVGYAPHLSLQVKGIGLVSGAVFHKWYDSVGVVMLDARRCRVYLPIKDYKWVVVTGSGTLYLGYVVGGGFCVSSKDGVISPAQGLYFADHDGAVNVFYNGGVLPVQSEPVKGLVPVYVPGKSNWIRTGLLSLERGSFRRGERIAEIIY